MIIPQAGTGRVESVGRVDPKNKGAAAASKYNMISSVLKSGAETADYMQVLQDQKQSMQAGNAAIAESAAYANLSQQEFVNERDLPNDVVATMQATKSGIQSDSGITYAQDVVGPELSNYFSAKIQEQEDGISNNRSRLLFNKFVGETVSKNVNKGRSNVLMAQVSAGRREYDTRIKALMLGGNISEALNTVDMAHVSGFYNSDQKVKQKNAVYRRAGEQLSKAIDNQETAYVNAIADGSPNEIKAAKANIETLIKDARGHGDNIIKKEEAAERIRLVDVAGDDQLTQQELMDVYGTKGFAAAQATLDSWMTDSQSRPNHHKQEEWDKQLTGLNSMLARIQTGRNKVADSLIKTLDDNDGVANLNHFLSLGQSILGDGPEFTKAQKAADSLYLQQMNELNLTNPSEGEYVTAVRDFVAKYKYFPRGLQNELKTLISNDTPTSLTKAANIWQTLKDDRTTRFAVDQIDLKKQSLLSDVSTVLRDYPVDMQANEISSLTDRYYGNDRKEIKAAQLLKYGEDLKPVNLFKEFKSDVLSADLFGNYFFADPEATKEAQVSWERIVRDQIQSGASFSAAKDTANAAIEGTYSVTKTDPKYPQGKLMRNAPDVLGEWAVNQWNKDKSKISSSYPEGTQVFLNSNGIGLQRDAGKGQVYPIMVRLKGSASELQLINEDGTLSYYQPNYKSTPEYAKAMRLQEQDKLSITATKNMIVQMREGLTNVVNEAIEKNPSSRANNNWLTNYAMVDLLNDAKTRLKTDPSMFDAVEVTTATTFNDKGDPMPRGFDGTETVNKFNTNRYKRAAKQIDLLGQQIIYEAGKRQDESGTLSSSRGNKPVQMDNL